MSTRVPFKLGAIVLGHCGCRGYVLRETPNFTTVMITHPGRECGGAGYENNFPAGLLVLDPVQQIKDEFTADLESIINEN